MRIQSKIFSVIFTMLSVTYAAASAHASALVFVSKDGNDTNGCFDPALPCKSVFGALSKVDAGGEIDVLDAITDAELVISTSVVINGGASQGGSISGIGTVPAISITAGSSDVVTLRNLNFNLCAHCSSTASGILFRSGAALHLDNVRVYGFGKYGVEFTPTGNAKLFVKDSTIGDNSGGGVYVKPSGTASVLASLVGVTLTRNAFGLRVEDRSKATVRDSVANQNRANAFVAVSSTGAAEINIEASQATENAGCGATTSGTGATVRISQVGIFDNACGVGPRVFSYGNNEIDGNTSNGAPSPIPLK